MAFVSKHQQKVEQDEKELEDLIKQHQPNPEEETQEEVQTQVEELSEEEATFKKRYGDLRRFTQKQTKELNERIEALEKALADRGTQEPAEVPANMQEMIEWKEKYPSVARIIETMIEQEADKKFKDAKISLDELKSKQKDSEKDKAFKEILKVHSDFEDLQASDEFHDWAEQQPRWVQVALYEQDDDPQSVIKVISLYKFEAQAEKAKADKPLKDKEDKKKAAGLVDTRGQRTTLDSEEAGSKIKESWVSKLSIKEYEKNEDKILEAIRTGNFVYDISGGAR